jgi:hypothetical protein
MPATVLAGADCAESSLVDKSKALSRRAKATLVRLTSIKRHAKHKAAQGTSDGADEGELPPGLTPHKIHI